jgi:hypothetical protein
MSKGFVTLVAVLSLAVAFTAGHGIGSFNAAPIPATAEEIQNQWNALDSYKDGYARGFGLGVAESYGFRERDTSLCS